MKAMFIVLFALVLMTSIMSAGTPMTSQGDKALTFSITGLGNFGVTGITAATFTGVPDIGSLSLTGVGGKYFINQDMAIRGALDFATVSTTTKTAQGDDKTTTTAFALSPGLEWHMNAAGAVSPYWGFMGQFGMVKATVTPAGGTEVSGSGTVFGLAAFLGAEWYAFDGVSFNAEYQLGFATQSTKTEAAGQSTDGPSVTRFGTDSFAVGLNIYLGH